MARLVKRTSLELNRSYSTKSDPSVTKKSILISTISRKKKRALQLEREPDPTVPLDSVSTGEPDTEVDIYGEASNLRLEVEKTCVIALKTIVNMEDDSEGGKTRRELLEYTRKVFPVYERWDELYKEAQEEKITEWKLIVTVLKGTVVARDPNGKSDPYVRMGVIHKKHLDKRIVEHDNLTAWKRENFVIGDPKNSAVIDKTLTPEWNEQIELKFNDRGNDVLALEVWDNDGAVDGQETRLKEFTVTGFRRFVKNTFGHDDFIGRTFFNLWDIRGAGEERDLKLFSHSKKHERGSVRVKLRLESVRKNLTPEEGFVEHKLLAKSLVNAESRTKRGRYKRDWDGHLSEKAELLVNNHSFLVQMNEAQRKAIDLNVLVRYHRLFGVSVTTFLQLVLYLKRQYALLVKLEAPKEDEEKPDDLITEDDYFPDPADSNKRTTDEWVKEMLRDLEELVLNCVIVTLRVHITKLQLQDISDAYKAGSEKNYQTLSAYVKLADELFTFHELAVHLEEKKQSVTKLVTDAIPLGASDWFQLAKDKATVKPKPKDSEPESEAAHTKPAQTEVMDGLEKLCCDTLDICGVARARIAPVFRESAMQIDYFSHFFLAISKLISEEVITVLNDTVVAELDEEATLKTFSCYISVKSIKDFGVEPTVDWNIVDPDQLSITTLHKEFKVLVPVWIEEASDRCKKSITNAIEFETVKVITDEVKFSSSVVDATGFLRGLFKVRDDLEWPVTVEKMEFTLMIMEKVTNNALFYVEDVFMRMKDEYLFDEEGQFKASPELGIILNNMWHMGQVFVQWGDIVPPVKEGEKDNTEIVATHTKLSDEIKNLLESFDREVRSKISTIVMMIIEKLRPDLERRLMELLDLKEVVIPPNYDKMAIDPQDIGSIGPLRDYLQANLQTLAQILFIDVFYIILKDVWRVSLEAISALIDYITQEELPNRADLHERLYYSLIMIKTFINSDGHGISYDVLEDDNYQALAARLDLLRQPTDKLILRFLHNLSIPQTERKQLGKLYVTASYLEDRSLLEVNILRANDLSAPTPTWFQCYSLIACYQTFSPYIEVNLLPHWLFVDSSRDTHKTSKQKNTPSPVYNEFVQLPASREDLAVEGASLVFTVFNQSCGKHYCGMAIISGKELIRAETRTPPPPSTVTTATNTDPQPVASADSAETSPADGEGSSLEETDSRSYVNFTLPVFSYGGDCAAHAEIIERIQFKDARAVDFEKRYSNILKVCK